MSQHTFFVYELATLSSLYFHTFILRLYIEPCTFLSLTPKNYEQATFRFSWQLRKIFTGGTPIPYFDQSVAYEVTRFDWWFIRGVCLKLFSRRRGSSPF